MLKYELLLRVLFFIALKTEMPSQDTQKYRKIKKKCDWKSKIARHGIY